jgi:hypothetical protein
MAKESQKAVIERLTAERESAILHFETCQKHRLEEQAAHAETKKKLDEVTKKAAQDRSDELKTFTDGIAEARETERKRRAAAYESMVLYAATLRSGLLLLLRNSESTEESDARAKKYDEAVKKLYEAKPPKETADALKSVCGHLEEAQENGARTHAIVATMLDQAFPKVETDSVASNWWPMIAGVGMIGVAAYMMMRGSRAKAGAGWGGTP